MRVHVTRGPIRTAMHILLSILLLLSCVTAQVTWSPIAPSEETSLLTYDSARDRLVLFEVAHGETWESNGQGWSRIPLSWHPPATGAIAMVYDAARAVTVLFARNAGTWEWDGVVWVRVFPASNAQLVGECSIAFDSTRGRVVMFSSVLWEWDGANWTQLPNSNGPSANLWHDLVYDPVRQRLVLFGSPPAPTFPNVPAPSETWEWDGSAWSLRAQGFAPYSNRYRAMVFRTATGRVLLFGGTSISGWTDQAWEWDGVVWTLVATSGTPGARITHSMTYDTLRNSAVLFGGLDMAFQYRTDTWALDASGTWTQRIEPGTPDRSRSSALAFDLSSGEVIQFGGNNQNGSSLSDETWAIADRSWSLRSPLVRPPARQWHAMTTNPATGRALLFGGVGSTGTALADTWEWLGTTWLPVASPTSPSARSGHTMCANTHDNTVLLFGGGGQNSTNETWQWDAATRTWSQRTPASAPSARAGAGMAYDARHDRTVLFGGGNLLGFLADTWEWDGGNWLQRSPVVHPSARSFPAIDYDADRARVVMFAGGSPQGLSDTWEWDGTAWTQRTPIDAAPITSQTQLAYDLIHHRTLAVAFDANGATRVWSYTAVHPATWNTFGTGCAGSAGIPQLSPIPPSLPWLGDTLALRTGPVAAGQNAILAMGTRAQWGSTPLPFAMGAYGMPGCTLLAGGYALLPMLTSGPIATVTLFLPNNASLLGGTIDAQAFVTDPAANAAGLIATAGMTLQIGGR